MKIFVLTIFCVMFTLPCFGFDVSVYPKNPKGGEAFLLSITGESSEPCEILFNKKKYTSFVSGQGKSAIYLPLGIEAFGKQNARVRMLKDAKTSAEKNVDIDIQKRVFNIVYLKTSDESMREKQPMVKSQNAILLGALKYVSDKKLWASGFSVPIDSYTISGEYATQRKGKKYSYFHKGVDMAAPAGTPVKAANSGKVILCRGLSVYGNSIVIDHGQGIVSCYFHLNKMLKKKGDNVKKGEVIAKVGSSGWATGPHLHFGLYIQGEAVDPLWWEGFSAESGVMERLVE